MMKSMGLKIATMVALGTAALMGSQVVYAADEGPAETQVAVQAKPVTADQDQPGAATPATPKAVASPTDQVSAAEAPPSRQNSRANHSTITVPQGMTRANYDQYQAGELPWAAYTKQFDVWQHTPDKQTLSHFVSNQADQAQVLRGVAMTQKQKVDLTRFAAAVLNDVRDQYGTPVHVQSTEGMLALAADVVKAYEADNWLLMQHGAHDDAGIGRAAVAHGLNGGGNYYENLSAGYLQPSAGSAFTMNDMKKAVYDSIVGMLYADAGSDFGHTISLLGDQAQNLNGEYFGLGVDKMTQIHLLLVMNDPNYIREPDKFDLTPLPIGLIADAAQPLPAVKPAALTVGPAKPALRLQANRSATTGGQTPKAAARQAARQADAPAAKALPQTGEQASGVGAGLGLVLATLSLGLAGSRRRSH